MFTLTLCVNKSLWREMGLCSGLDLQKVISHLSEKRVLTLGCLAGLPPTSTGIWKV